MTEDFRNWLSKNPSIKKEYDKHSEFREEIFEDYQKETAFEDFDSWLDWALKNEETAKKHFPHIMDTLENAVLRSSDFKNANVIQIAADAFPKWRKEAAELIGPAKRKFIVGQIRILSLILNETEDKSQLEKQTIGNLRDEFEANLKYWQAELEKLGPTVTTSVHPKSEVEGKIRKLFEEDNDNGWQKYFGSEKDFSQVVELLRSNIEGLPYELPKTPIPAKKRTKTDLGNLLGKIHYLSPNEILKKDHNYIALVQCISPFHKEKKVASWLTRDRT